MVSSPFESVGPRVHVAEDHAEEDQHDVRADLVGRSELVEVLRRDQAQRRDAHEDKVRDMRTDAQPAIPVAVECFERRGDSHAF